MFKQDQLDLLATEIEQCEVCKIQKTGMAVPGEGNPDADIVFIGEAPGKTEAATGRPFIGRSGQLLRSLIREIGLDDVKDVYITSPVKYLPKHGTPTSLEIAHGRDHLMQQLAVIQPEFVVLLGRVAAEGVLGRKVFVTKDHGKIIEERDGPSRRGVEPKRRIKYFLTYHPAAVLRFPGKFSKLWKEDFLRIAQLRE